MQDHVVRRLLALATALAGLVAPALLPTSAGAAVEQADPQLFLVTLRAPGAAAYDGPLDPAGYQAVLEARQDQVLDAVGAVSPLYRWTSALSGVAVDLTEEQARALLDVPGVVAVEPNTVRHLASRGTRGARQGRPSGPATGGQGVVIGVVDSGLWPDSSVFADVPGLGPAPTRFHGDCEEPDFCSHKVVGARWFVAGFGSQRLRSASSLSPRDDSGHGTLMASIAAGNGGVSVRVGAQRLGTYAGAAPRARLAIYKACWTAPDPADDGCATADLVTAIDRATADGVDVLNLSVADTTPVDTVERALLGATLGGVFVAAAAGNTGASGHAAHADPWVVTVGAVATPVRGGEVRAAGGPALAGAMVSRRTVTGPLVLGRDVPAPSATPSEAAVCAPGSLDAARAGGHVVLCDRGAVGRVDKSRAVELADGIGMVLADTHGDDVHADFHAVPTVHLSRASADELRSWLRLHAEGTVTLRPGPDVGTDATVPAWSAPGDPAADLVKPDLTAAGVDILGAEQPTVEDPARWNNVTGTSAATARVSGLAARVLAVHPTWTPDRVRSALLTTAAPVSSSASSLRQGSGQVDADAALQPGLVYAVSGLDYLRYLAGRIAGRDLNLPSIKVDGPATVHRTVTSVGGRPMYYSVTASGFARHQVTVEPEAIRIRPRGQARFTVTIVGPGDRLPDSGWITWLGNNGITVRIPVVISR